MIVEDNQVNCEDISSLNYDTSQNPKARRSGCVKMLALLRLLVEPLPYMMACSLT